MLGKFRTGELTVTQDAVTLILESLDCIKGLLSALEQTEAEMEQLEAQLVAARFNLENATVRAPARGRRLRRRRAS